MLVSAEIVTCMHDKIDFDEVILFLLDWHVSDERRQPTAPESGNGILGLGQESMFAQEYEIWPVVVIEDQEIFKVTEN